MRLFDSRARAESRDHDDAALMIERLVGNIETVVRGKGDVVRLAVTALLARGHVLVEDVPGVGKTTLAEALARSVSGTFHRIQFTSDLLPSDLIGISIWNPETRAFEFRKGPLFAHLVLADEINRATPKTQSALLECMAEGTVTTDDHRHVLPDPFLVIATQNPVDHSGTFPLPDSQLDRFLLRTRMGYPSAGEEVAILQSGAPRPAAAIQPVLSLEEVRGLQERAGAVHCDDDLAAYIVAIVTSTREAANVETGASPRASVDLHRASRARALMAGRDHVIPDDIKSLAVPVLAHRLVLRDGQHGSRDAGRRSEALLRTLADTVDVPT